MSQQYEFDLRAVEHDREGYYFPRWDRARKITVIAATEQQAINEAAAVLGEPRGNGRAWYWGFKVDGIRPATTGEEPA